MVQAGSVPAFNSRAGHTSLFAHTCLFRVHAETNAVSQFLQCIHNLVVIREAFLPQIFLQPDSDRDEEPGILTDQVQRRHTTVASSLDSVWMVAAAAANVKSPAKLHEAGLVTMHALALTAQYSPTQTTPSPNSRTGPAQAVDSTSRAKELQVASNQISYEIAFSTHAFGQMAVHHDSPHSKQALECIRTHISVMLCGILRRTVHTDCNNEQSAPNCLAKGNSFR